MTFLKHVFVYPPSNTEHKVVATFDVRRRGPRLPRRWLSLYRLFRSHFELDHRNGFTEGSRYPCFFKTPGVRLRRLLCTCGTLIQILDASHNGCFQQSSYTVGPSTTINASGSSTAPRSVPSSWNRSQLHVLNFATCGHLHRWNAPRSKLGRASAEIITSRGRNWWPFGICALTSVSLLNLSNSPTRTNPGRCSASRMVHISLLRAICSSCPKTWVQTVTYQAFVWSAKPPASEWPYDVAPWSLA